MRIVSFLPTATEMLYALGLGSSLVGRSEHCVYPPAVRRKPVVVSSRIARTTRQDSAAIHKAVKKLKEEGAHQFQIDRNLLKRLRPDLLLTQNLCSVCAASHPEIEEAIVGLSPKPRILSLQGQNLKAILSDLTALGKATGKTAAAARVKNRLQERIARVRRRLRGISHRPRVWCCEWLEPLMAAGHWIPEMVEIAGGTDGLGQPGRNSRWLSWDQVRADNPEIIVVMPCSYTIRQTLREQRRLTGRPGWEKLPAVKDGRVFAVDGAFTHHAPPRLVDGIELFARLFHPDRMPGRQNFKLNQVRFSARLSST